MTPQQKYLDIVDEVIAKGPFKPDWVSLSDYETPKWLKNGKFGIFIHWGLFLDLRKPELRQRYIRWSVHQGYDC